MKNFSSMSWDIRKIDQCVPLLELLMQQVFDGHKHDYILDDRVIHVNQYGNATIRCYEWVEVSKKQL
jgi:hypothetical protein